MMSRKMLAVLAAAVMCAGCAGATTDTTVHDNPGWDIGEPQPSVASPTPSVDPRDAEAVALAQRRVAAAWTAMTPAEQGRACFDLEAGEDAVRAQILSMDLDSMFDDRKSDTTDDLKRLGTARMASATSAAIDELLASECR